MGQQGFVVIQGGYVSVSKPVPHTDTGFGNKAGEGSHAFLSFVTPFTFLFIGFDSGPVYVQCDVFLPAFVYAFSRQCDQEPVQGSEGRAVGFVRVAVIFP